MNRTTGTSPSTIDEHEHEYEHEHEHEHEHEFDYEFDYGGEEGGGPPFTRPVRPTRQGLPFDGPRERLASEKFLRFVAYSRWNSR